MEKSQRITVHIKSQLQGAYVFSMLLHAAETWTLKNKDKRRLLVFERWCYRSILNIDWQEHRTNESIRSKIHRKELITDIIHRKITLFGTHLQNVRQSPSEDSDVWYGSRRPRPRNAMQKVDRRRTGVVRQRRARSHTDRDQ